VLEASRISLAIFVIAAALLDLWRRRIPNWLVLTGAGFAFALAILSGNLSTVGATALGLLVAFAVYLLLYAIRAVGAGDVKLMAAVGAFTGVRGWFTVFFLSAIAGGIVALIVIIARGRLQQTLRNVTVILSELAHGRAPHAKSPELDVRSSRAMRLPHGFSIALGTLLYLSIEGFGILRAM
jgi:prepilin peptidase CpaA